MFLDIAISIALVSAASAAVLTVKVGDGGLVYNPASITAQKGDVINFQFTGSPGNHTISQAAFDKPCEELPGGFDSGYAFVPANFTRAPAEWNLTVSDASKPIWFYCKQSKPQPHCISGMVGAINPPSTGNTLDNFISAAKALGSLPAQSSGTLSGIGAAATAAPSPLASASAASPGSASATKSTTPSSSSSAKSNAAVSVNSNSLAALLIAVMGVIIA